MDTTLHTHTHNLMTKDELHQKYNDLAPIYSRAMWVENYLFGVPRLRQRLMVRATGKVLDVACGTGENFLFLKADTSVTAIDLSTGMLDIARARAAKLGINADCRLMDAETMALPDQTFDTVVSALSTCTFPDPIAALREMGRVCKPNGQILLLEHGHSRYRLINRYLDSHVEQHYAVAGCRWNQEPPELVQRAGLRITTVKRGFFGVFI